MFPVINLHRVDCQVCRYNLNECVQWDLLLTSADTEAEEASGSQPLIFTNSDGEEEDLLPVPSPPASPEQHGEVLMEDVVELGHMPEDDDYDYDDDDDDDDDDDWSCQDTMLSIFARDSNFSIRLPAASTEDEVQFVTDSALDSLNKLISPVQEYFRRQRADRNIQLNPSTAGFPGEGQSASTTCTSSSSNVSNVSEEDEEMRLLADIRSAQARRPKRRPRSPRPFDYMVPEYGRDHPLLAMMDWKADAWGVSFGVSGDSYTPGWYPIYNTPPSTAASRTSNPEVSMMAQNNPAQQSSRPGNDPSVPDEDRAHSSNATPAVDQNGRNHVDQSGSRKRRRDTNSPNTSQGSERESSASKMRRENEQE